MSAGQGTAQPRTTSFSKHRRRAPVAFAVSNQPPPTSISTSCSLPKRAAIRPRNHSNAPLKLSLFITSHRAGSFRDQESLPLFFDPCVRGIAHFVPQSSHAIRSSSSVAAPSRRSAYATGSTCGARVWTEYPLRSRGVAATRLHGMPTSQPRRRVVSAECPRRSRGVESSPWNAHVTAAASSRLHGMSTS